MPTPRRHGGAAAQHIPLTVPGYKGLNTQAASSILGPEWATLLLNAVLDENNRVASRKGWQNVTATAIPAGAQFNQIHEYRKKTGEVELVGVGDDSKLYSSTDDGTTWSDVTGVATVSSPTLQFRNFRDKLIAFQEAGTPLLYEGVDFSNVVSGGDEPMGNCGLAAFGRLWVADSDKVSIKYSGLLNESDFSSSDSGVISMENVWRESDEIVAIEVFNGSLVVLGRDNIVVFSDGTGSVLGLNPLTAYVTDIIGGIGCIARDSVENVKGDLWFLSKDGLQSLGRLVQEKSNPLNNLSKNIQDFLLEAVNDPEISLEDVKSIYSPEDKFYLLSLPRARSVGGQDVETGRCFAFDTRGLLDDGSARVMGQWTGLVPRCLLKRRNNDLLIGITNVPGAIGKYAGYLDNGNSYTYIYESGWIDVTGTQGYLIIPKRIDGIFFVGQDSTVTIKWAFDFSSIFASESVEYAGISNFASWAESEWANSSWGGGGALKEASVAGSGTGEFVKLGVQAIIGGGTVAVQQLDLFAKIGRLK